MKIKFKGVCALREQPKPEVNFPCNFVDYGSLVPCSRKVLIPSRSLAFNLGISRIIGVGAGGKRWILIFSPNVKIIKEEFEEVAGAKILLSKGKYGGQLIDSSPHAFAFLIYYFYFPPFNMELSDPDALKLWFDQVKRLRSAEIEPFWSL